MGVTVAWDNEAKTTLCLTYQQPWNWADFDAAQGVMYRLMASVTHPVDVILDISAMGMFPPNALSHLRELAKVRVPNQGIAVFVGARLLEVKIIETIQKTATSEVRNVPLYFVPTREEARHLLARS